MSGSPPELCPSSDDLAAFDLGMLPEERLVSVADHLQHCEPCQTRLAGLGPQSDSLLNGLKRHLSPNAPTAIPTGDTRDVFGSFTLLEKLGEGGMGVVHKAYQPRLKRIVALKRISGLSAGEEYRQRFFAEAQAVARLQHANIVQVYEFGEHDGRPYCALEYVGGGSLERRIKEQVLAPATAARVMVAVARAIDVAHQHDLVHRDLKPANILLQGEPTTPVEQCVPKVTDFGVAKLLDVQDSQLTRAGAILGTPAFMAPEQARGDAHEATPVADVYSLGATLYALVCGRPPFQGVTVNDTLQQVCDSDPVRPRHLNRRVPRDLETICLKCLEKLPSRRYASAGLLADDLDRYLRGEPIAARPVNPVGRLARWCQRRPALATLSAVVVMGCLVGIAGAFWATYSIANERARAVDDANKRKDAEERQRQAENLAQSRHYYSVYNQALEAAAQREAGWSWKVLEHVRAAAAIPTDQRDPARLRAVAAVALSGTDLRPIRPLAPNFQTRFLKFHPNGRWVILSPGFTTSLAQLVDSMMEVRIVDVESGATVHRLKFPRHKVTGPKLEQSNCLTVSADGRWLVVGTRSGWLHRWDLQQVAPQSVSWNAGQPSSRCEYVAFDSTGASLYCATNAHDSDTGRLTRWECTNWSAASVHDTGCQIRGLAVNPVGSGVYGAWRGQVHYLDPKSLRPTGRTIDCPSGRLVVSSGGQTLTDSFGPQVHLLDVARGMVVREISETSGDLAHASGPIFADFSPDGRLLATASEASRHVKIWDLTNGRRVAEWQMSGSDIGHVTPAPAFDPAGRYVAVSAGPNSCLYEVADHKTHDVIAVHSRRIREMALAPDARTLSCLAESGIVTSPAELTRWNLEAGARPQILGRPLHFATASNPPTIADSAIAMDVSRNAVAAAADGDATMFKLAGDSPPSQTWTVPSPEAMCFGRDGRLWIAQGDNVLASRIPLDTRFLKWSNEKSTSGLTAMYSLAAGPSWVVAGGRDGNARLFDARIDAHATVLRLIATWSIEYRTPLRAIALNQDDSLALIGCDNGRAAMVRLPKGEVVHRWSAHGDRVSGVAFLTRDLFVTGGWDRTLRLWKRLENGVEELVTIRTAAPVRTLAASTDGRTLTVVLEGERGVHRWRLDELLRQFRTLGIGVDEPIEWKTPIPGWSFPHR